MACASFISLHDLREIQLHNHIIHSLLREQNKGILLERAPTRLQRAAALKGDLASHQSKNGVIRSAITSTPSKNFISINTII